MQDAVVAASMPARIVVHLNEWAREALKERDDTERARMQKVLRVLDLEWSDDAECLIHALGIGKWFDVSDAEHTLCLIFTLHQATIPLRTISKGYEVDSVKVFPIRVNVGEVAARELPCMAKFLNGWEGRLKAYQDLLKDEEFDHQSLRVFPRVEGDPEDANGVEAGAVRGDDNDNYDDDNDNVPRTPVRFPAWRYGAGNRHERCSMRQTMSRDRLMQMRRWQMPWLGGAGVWTGDVLGGWRTRHRSACSASPQRGFDNSAALVERKAALHAMQQESNLSSHVGAFEEV
ncbi:hypothetical protein ACHAXT_004828 [Thalassiosira profunda]